MGERDQRYREIFDACYAPLHAFARRRVPAGESDDLVAEVLMTAWRRLDDVPAEAVLPWLYGVAHRTLANQRRADSRRRRLLQRVAANQVVGVTSVVTEPPPVVDALARLREDDQEILRLAAWEELPAAEIAVVLGCTPNAASLRLSRARQRLRAELARRDLDTAPRHGRV